MRIGRGAVRLIAMAIAGSVLTGCGVPLQDAAEPLASAVLPTQATPSSASPSAPPRVSPTPEPTADGRLRLWFVQDDGLAAVESSLPTAAAPSEIVQALTIGPSEPQADAGLRTVARDPLTGVAFVTVSPGVEPVTAQLSPAFASLPSSEQVLLLGQVVLSLAAAGHSPVAFTDDTGTPVAVPLPDGRLLDTPARARDYTALIVVP